MSRNLLSFVVFVVGLAAVCWIGAGYIGSNPLGAAVALVIAACYLAGAWELRRYAQATATLRDATAQLDATPATLGEWLQRLHPSLRPTVRLRVEGERAALPAPALTPYLVGLLVLLGMLGTLLGMMATLRGTGLALESATDLSAMRGSLAAPVKGLGFAFGTSIAGVASSAMLGLLSALCRRERLVVVQQLDAKIASTLRVFSQAHQREESFRMLQQQATLMPALVERMESMMSALQSQGIATHERQLAGQDAFHARTEAAYAQLAASVGQSLKDSVAEGARAASTALQPVVDATMAGLSRETTALHAAVTQAVQRQVDEVSAQLKATTTQVSSAWTTSLDEHRRSNETLAQELRASHAQLADAFEQRATTVTANLASVTGDVSSAWARSLDAQGQANASLVQDLRDAHAQLSETMAQRFAAASASMDAMTTHVAGSWAASLASHDEANAALANDLRHAHAQLSDDVAQRAHALLDAMASRLDATTHATRDAWNDALSRQQIQHEALTQRHHDALVQASTAFEANAGALVATVSQSHADLQQALAERDRARLDAWTQALEATGATLGQQWAKASDDAVVRQQAICDTLASTASDITTQARTHAGDTIAEISRLVQAASEAPKAAAEVVAELRQKLSDSMVRDTAMLDERARLLSTLETLLDAVNHASTEQRTAVDALVSTTADLLDRVGTRFTDHVQEETGKLNTAAAQLTGSAVEVASLGDAFGAAVQLFGDSNAQLMERLDTIAVALDHSLTRSDEQLAYYVAQAREVVDLSVLSQKQIIEDMQQLAGQRAGADAA